MKTYKEVVEKPRLEILPDDCVSDTPRDWDNLGYFVTVERDYLSPDRDTAETDAIKTIIETTQYTAKDAEEHMKLIKKDIEDTLDDTVLYITPVYKYEHGNVVYRRGTANGFDISNCGFYIVTKKTRDVVGTPKKSFEKVIDGELEMYTKWCNGDVWGYILYDEDGEQEDSCWGFFDIEDMKEHLPKEWQKEDLEEYIKY